MKRFKAALVGGTGYAGAEIIRRLVLHPEVELVRVTAADHVGAAVGDVHLSLTGRVPLRFESLPPAEAARGCDVAFLGLPSEVSAQAAPAVLAAGARVIDLSGAYRLKRVADYERYYGGKHPHPELFGTFVYGLPEIHRDAIKRARAVAQPGCFATTIELALLPLARAGLLRGAVPVLGMTGSTGAGVVPSPTTHHPLRALNLRSYKPLAHQHIPEIEDTLAEAAGAAGTSGAGGERPIAVRFVPVSAPLSRGILVAAFVEVPATATAETIAAHYRRAYDGEPFVRFLPDRVPEVAAVAGSNFAEIGFSLGEPTGATRTLCVQAASDNLLKGGAGQAIQNMNLMLGLPETTALDDPGPWP